ncbi:mannose-1-phosphate guanylyltransferase/mannose-6-phosphate isomerase [Candidatus Methylopumilus universalis]|jgi:mannose-1-phosphate guanylyltransferase/mannose-6-phosphate isomerase|uniref:mannose-1-phosphate guanylyltransferase/mannose-6-phosphate isomerase n=1 Tax=Candidatus Methylopumilus universalis TaxID=2588536 RepID=UPI00167EB01C|nr:mannose-1-phosphate guanylyltransferase/mannose-6-phosphate isomerase [Candidatus Methylopumilus universalis]
MIFPVLLSGGSGTRLWPLSRAGFPKQFLDLFQGQSLFQMTLLRLKGLSSASKPIVICNEAHRFIISEQASDIKVALSSIMLEPSPRNTAPAIAIAALELMRQGKPDAVMLVLPSDHVITNEKAFVGACEEAKTLAERGYLVTFGIKPLRPETGFGYIKATKKLSGNGLEIDEFVEKPNSETAKTYLSSGHYFWNSGMFMFKASQILNELSTYHPKIVEACEKAIAGGIPDLDFFRLDEKAFNLSPLDSIDYAVMEKTSLAAMVMLEAGWSDVGAWPSVWELQEKDQNGNAGHGDFMTRDAHNNYIHSEKRLVSLLGVEDLMVIETPDAVMVAHKDRAQDVKQLVDALKEAERGETEVHKKIFRPWGSFDEIDRGEHFQVKRIVVKPHEKLSLQLHHKRAEHWVVVAGKAKVHIGDEVKILSENESIYIPKETKHSLENLGDVNLEIVEIQTGSYLGEDDIVRFEDRYGRVSLKK